MDNSTIGMIVTGVITLIGGAVAGYFKYKQSADENQTKEDILRIQKESERDKAWKEIMDVLDQVKQELADVRVVLKECQDDRVILHQKIAELAARSTTH